MENHMKVDLFSIGPFTVHSYGLMIAIGMIAAFFTTEYSAKRAGLNPEPVFSLGFVGIAGGLIGAKVLFWITDIKNIIANPSAILDIGNGFVVYGGIVGGILAGYIFCRIKKLSFIKYLDAATPTIALAQGFGRIGCFLAGCCYGAPTDAWYGIVFKNSTYAPNGVSLIPSQLIYSGADFLNFIILSVLTKKLKGDGKISSLYLIFYSVGRFLLEYIRGDVERGNVGIFSTSQFISLFVMVLGIVMYVLASKKKFEKE